MRVCARAWAGERKWCQCHLSGETRHDMNSTMQQNTDFMPSAAGGSGIFFVSILIPGNKKRASSSHLDP